MYAYVSIQGIDTKAPQNLLNALKTCIIITGE